MRIGILSDSHGKSKRVRKAVALLTERGMDALVHCGDLCEEDDLALLAAAGVPVYLVAGNMDHPLVDDLRTAAKKLGVHFAADFVAVHLDDGRYLAATHGHLTTLDDLVCGGQFSYVCHGHTHRLRDERFELTRVLNPGALFHPKSSSDQTVMRLDTDTDSVEILVVH